MTSFDATPVVLSWGHTSQIHTISNFIIFPTFTWTVQHVNLKIKERQWPLAQTKDFQM